MADRSDTPTRAAPRLLLAAAALALVIVALLALGWPQLRPATGTARAMAAAGTDQPAASPR